MLIKKHITNSIERAYLQLKGLGRLYFIPLLIMYIMIPIMINLSVLNPIIKDDLGLLFVKQCNFFLPILSVWWVSLVLREYVEGDGNELLYVNGKVKVWETLILYMAYLIHLLPFFFIASFYLTEAFPVFIEISVISFLYCGIVYCFVFLTKAMVVSVLPLLCYTFYVNTPSSNNLESINYLSLINGPIFDIEGLLPFLFAGVVSFLLGVCLNRFQIAYT